MKHKANPRFWNCYRQLPQHVQQTANDCYALLRQDPKHPSLHFKKAGRFWSVRIGLHYRALAVEQENDITWFWIGSHESYNKLIAGR